MGNANFFTDKKTGEYMMDNIKLNVELQKLQAENEHLRANHEDIHRAEMEALSKQVEEAVEILKMIRTSEYEKHINCNCTICSFIAKAEGSE